MMATDKSKCFPITKPPNMRRSRQGKHRLLRSRDLNWDKTVPCAIQPAYLDDCNLNRRAKEAFDAYAESVERLRQPRRKPKGSRSLLDTAFEILIANLSDVDDLGNLPMPLVKRLWTELHQRCTLTFHSWKLLSRVLYQESDATLGMFHYRKRFTEPSYPLPVYTEPLASNSFDFITSLSIHVDLSVKELVNLANIPNLGCLEIMYDGLVECDESRRKPFLGEGDILMKAWSREAADNSAFKVLRILRLRNRGKLTKRSLRYLHNFVALGIFEVWNCGITNEPQTIKEAEELGWMTTERSPLTLLHLESQKRGFLPSVGSIPLWAGSFVHQVKRSEAQGQQDKVSRCEEHIRLDRSSLKDLYLEFAKKQKSWLRTDYCLFNAAVECPTWDLDIASTWALLGQLRNDSDLIAAGVKNIEKQTLVQYHTQDYMLSPVRMAYISIGTRGETSQRCLSRRGMAFVRMQPSSQTDPLSSDHTGGHVEIKGNGRKRAGQGSGAIRPSKKQNLASTLSGFLF